MSDEQPAARASSSRVGIVPQEGSAGARRVGSVSRVDVRHRDHEQQERPDPASGARFEPIDRELDAHNWPRIDEREPGKGTA